MINKLKIFFLTICILFFSIQSFAFTITSQLTGDPRSENPDGLIVDVTIEVDEINSPSTASWEIDINSPLHADIKLDAFYFNLNLAFDDVTFDNFFPTDWNIFEDQSVHGAGTGNTIFIFEADEGTGVTNSVSLSFDMLLNTGVFIEDYFLGADVVVGDAGSGQLGAHLQSLTLWNTGDPAYEDSGFAFGNYTSTPVPEPATLILFGLGLAGLAVVNLRRKR